MILNHNELKHISHPMVESVYIKQEKSPEANRDDDNVLVIKFKHACIYTQKEREDILMDFLSKLDLIRDEVQQKSGTFRRIDLQGI